MEHIQSEPQDAPQLAELRAQAMKPSLEAVGRFDEHRVRHRFLESFEPEQTFKLVQQGNLIGFYVVCERDDHYWLDHLYILPEHQNRGLGRDVLASIIARACSEGLPLRLGALKNSLANRFYANLGFIKTHEDEFDIYYEYSVDI